MPTPTFFQTALKSLPIAPITSNHNTNPTANNPNTNLNRKFNNIVHCDGKDGPNRPYMYMWMKGWYAAHDVPALRRGYEVYRQVCSTCHGMKHIKFRHMIGEIYPTARVKQFAAAIDVQDGPNDEGEMFLRPGITTDSFPSPYPNDEAAAYSNGGATPPDLSFASATHDDGPEYIFHLLTCYREPPFGIHLRAGLYYNTYYRGGAISMPPPLTETGQVDYEDGTPSTISQMAFDVCQFLAFTCHPNIDEQKLMGVKVITCTMVACACCGYWSRFLFITNKTRRIDFTKVYL